MYACVWLCVCMCGAFLMLNMFASVSLCLLKTARGILLTLSLLCGVVGSLFDIQVQKCKNATKRMWEMMCLWRAPATLFVTCLTLCVCVCAGRQRWGRRDDDDEEEACERSGWGGCRGGKPIIVQITGRLWIFYPASSAALSFSLFLSVYFCLSALVLNLNFTSTELYWED